MTETGFGLNVPVLRNQIGDGFTQGHGPCLVPWQSNQQVSCCFCVFSPPETWGVCAWLFASEWDSLGVYSLGRWSRSMLTKEMSIWAEVGVAKSTPDECNFVNIVFGCFGYESIISFNTFSSLSSPDRPKFACSMWPGFS